MNNYELKRKFPFMDEKICNPRTGLVTNIFQWVPEPDDPRIYMVAAKMCKRDVDGHMVAVDFNSGAGFTLESAYRSAVGETIERYASSFISGDVKLSSFNELDDEAIEPEKFAFFADEQYQQSDFPYSKFTKNSVVGWTRAVNLTKHKVQYIPACCVYLPYMMRDGEEHIWDCVSTGLACSTSLEDAIIRGIYEVIERDAISNMWLNKLSMPNVNLCSDDEIEGLYQSRLKIPNCKYHVVDITTDIKVPTYFGVLEESEGGLLVSASTNVNPKKAIKKVLLELSQGRISWKQDFAEGINNEIDINDLDIRDFKSRAKLYTNHKMKKYAQFIYESNKIVNINSDTKEISSEDALSYLINNLKEKGRDILYVDVTPDDIKSAGYHVVRVVIPGLTEITSDNRYPRVGGQRLYDLPMKLGYSDKPTKFENFYTIPHPFP